ncbi:cytochrome c [Rhodoblastus sp.]|uniref:c-type cytochrome n=1 Tax=Rhodoblastus sp. TaxID=1962975 RepID=UPI0035B24D25
MARDRTDGRRRIFRRRRRALLAAALCVWAASIVETRGQDLAGDVARGKIRSKAEQCQECHGEAGQGTADHYPRLAGQWSAYLRKQLGDFQSGARKNEIMTAMASELSPQDIADIAAYFSAAPAVAGRPGSASARGEELFRRGDPARALPACASCHGLAAEGVGVEGDPVPVLAGQSEIYLANQLFFWKVEDRHNSAGGVMNAVARALSAEEIDALANYLSGLRPAEQKKD